MNVLKLNPKSDKMKKVLIRIIENKISNIDNRIKYIDGFICDIDNISEKDNETKYEIAKLKTERIYIHEELKNLKERAENLNEEILKQKKLFNNKLSWIHK